MPHVNSSGGDDLASTDEVKVYKEEGEEENRSSENLSEDKLGLVTESEEGKTSDIEVRPFPSEKSSTNAGDEKSPDPLPDRLGPFGYPYISPYPLPNGASLPGGLGGKVLSPPPGLGFYMYNDHFAQPPPAHMGISSVHIDPKTGFARPMYALPPPGQFPHPLYGPELSQWNGVGPGYPMSSGLRSPYSTSLSSSPLSRFSPPSLLPPHPGLPSSHPGIPHPAIVTPGPKQDIHSLHNSENHRHHHPNYHNGIHENEPPPERKKPYVKKPLNAFMLFMKEMRPKVIDECTLKESAAINQILGRKWHALDRSEQAKYYEMARKEKELHQQLYPGWSARDNYATHNKKTAKKRKRDPVTGVGHIGPGCGGSYNGTGSSSNPESDCPNAKKCRARYGLEAQNEWCKPCRRKKKCIRFLEDSGAASGSDGEEDEGGASLGDSTTEGDSSELGSPRSVPPPCLINQSDDTCLTTSAFSPSSRLPASSHANSLSHSTVNLLRPDRGPQNHSTMPPHLSSSVVMAAT